MSIEFFIPSDQVAPTNLRLLVDGIHVYYERLKDAFGYKFEVFTKDADKAMEIVDKVADIMCSQSYDHGAQWRVTSVKLIEQGIMSSIIEVRFRVRDAG